MNRWFNNLYNKNELSFALVWIGIYCVVNSLANPFSQAIGIDSSANLLFNLLLTIFLFLWVQKRDRMSYYGLCRTHIPARKFLWYLPLVVFMCSNLRFWFSENLPPAGTVCYILNMFCVGFLEELIFRGFLFQALAKDNVKTAIVVSSVTFGMGHILNLFNGSGMDLLSNLCQIVCAVLCGFLFVILFYRGGSLLPCIVAHSVHNALSVFADEASLPMERRLLFYAANMVVVVVYTLLLCKTLPPAPQDKSR